MRQVAICLLGLLAATVVVAGEQAGEPAHAPTEQDKMVAQALAEAGRDKLKAKEYEAAQQLLSQALEKHPGNPGAVYDLARVSQRLEQYGEATKLYRRYLKLTEGEGKTQQRVMAGIYLKKLDREYGEMEELRRQVVEGASDLLKNHEDNLNGKQKKTLQTMLEAFGHEAAVKKSKDAPGDRLKSAASQGGDQRTKAGKVAIRVRAYVDGTSQLHFTTGRMWWEHERKLVPGGSYKREEMEPTFINGREWHPQWANDRKRGPNRSKPVRIPLRLPDNFQVDLQEKAARGNVSAGRTSKGFVVSIHDGARGAAWYEFTVMLRAR
jgi:hypothetical protein